MLWGKAEGHLELGRRGGRHSRRSLGRGLWAEGGRRSRGFLFLYFLFLFFKKIYFYFRNLQEYTLAVPLPGGRDLVAPLRGGKGFSAKISRKFVKIFAEKPLEDRSPGSGAAGPPGRPAAGRPPPPPLYKGLAATPPLICLTKNPEKKRKERREGEEG